MKPNVIPPSVRLRACTLATALLLGGTAAHAENTLSLKQALQQTLDSHPQLLSFPYELRQLEAAKSQADLRPNPRLDMSLDNVLGNGDYDGTDRAELTVGLNQTIELGDKRQLRGDLVDSLTEQSRIEFVLTKQAILSETKRRYYELQRLQSLQSLLNQRSDIETKALRVIRNRASAGAVGQADVSKMALRLADSEAQLAQLAGNTESAKSSLAAMWLAESDYSSIEESGNTLPKLPPRDQVITALEQSPSYQQRYALEKLAEHRLSLSKAEGRSDVDLGVGIRRFEASNDQALVFSFSMPLALKNPNRGNIAKAESQWAQSKAETVLARQTLKLTALQSLQRLSNLQQQAATLHNKLLPLAKTLLRDTEKGYRRGNYNVLQWADAQSELFRLNRELIETRHQFFNEALELERLTGQDFASLTAGEQS